MRTARATDLVFARLFRQAEHIFAVLASAVDVCFSVANAVALKAEKSREALRKPQKIGILLAPFVEIF